MFYAMGGITVIVDAGGCAGNVSGFDERRFFSPNDSAPLVFSACLRDMDAILGRDERLVEKVRDGAGIFPDAAFVAYIGTPVPAVIGTDFRALCRMTEKRLGISAVAVDTAGLVTYSEGEEKAYKAIIDYAIEAKTSGFARQGQPASVKAASSSNERQGEMQLSATPCVMVFGASPLEMAAEDSISLLKERLKKEYPGRRVIIAGEKGSWEELRMCIAQCLQKSGCKENDDGRGENAYLALAVSPAGIKAAKYLSDKCGVKNELAMPLSIEAALDNAKGKSVAVAEGKNKSLPLTASRSILVIHQQCLANNVRNILQPYCGRIDVATFFEYSRFIAERGDTYIAGEDEFIQLVQSSKYSIIIGDPLLRRAVPFFNGEWVPLPHWAVSAQLHAVKEEAQFMEPILSLIDTLIGQTNE